MRPGIDEEFVKRFGRIVREARQDLGFSLRQLANEIGCRYQTISGLESGESGAYAKTTLRLMVYLGIDPQDIVGEPDEWGDL